MNFKSLIFSPIILLMVSLFYQCQPETPKKLPVLGFHDTNDQGDTIYHQIPDFSFINQDSQIVTNETFADKAYIVDFFFISCPTICPKLTKQMLRLHDKFKDNDQLLILSHTVDTKHDTIPRLKKYAQNLGVSSDKWHFVTGDQDEVYEIAEDYFSVAIENPDAPGGYDHSGRIILVDKNRQVRAFCNGTEPEEVDRFMKDIKLLLNED